jgi:acyl carrier protein
MGAVIVPDPAVPVGQMPTRAESKAFGLGDLARQLDFWLPLESGQMMQTPTSTAGFSRLDILTAIAESIRSVSPKAKGAVIGPDSRLLEELALDSLDLVAVILQLQDQFHVEIDPDDIPELHTVADLAATLADHLCQAA